MLSTKYLLNVATSVRLMAITLVPVSTLPNWTTVLFSQLGPCVHHAQPLPPQFIFHTSARAAL